MDYHPYTTLADRQSCAAQGTRTLHQEQLHLLSAAGLLKFLAMQIPGPLRKTKSGTQHVIILTDLYIKLPRAIPVTPVTSSSATTLFVDNRVILYGIPIYPLTNKGPQYVSRFFAAVTAVLGNRHLKSTAYHPPSDKQVENLHIYITLVPPLRHYIAENPTH